MTINRFALGLQSLLDQQTQGRNPSELQEFVQPTLDLFDMTLAGRGLNAEIKTNTAVSTKGNTAAVLIPEGELWLVCSVSARATATVVGTLEFHPVMINLLGSSSAIVPLASEFFLVNFANIGDEYVVTTGWLAKPIFARGPTSFASRIGDPGNGLGTYNVTTTVAFYRLTL